MKTRRFFPLVVILFGLFCRGIAPAMSIHDFAKMTVDDQATYVTALVEGSAKMLRTQGQPAQADKAIAFFKDSSKNGGVTQLASQLKQLNGLNKRNAINPNNKAHSYVVEDAMEAALKDEGIIVPLSYLLTINKDFTPTGYRLSPTLGQ
jgi:hypothetical protein